MAQKAKKKPAKMANRNIGTVEAVTNAEVDAVTPNSAKITDSRPRPRTRLAALPSLSNSAARAI